MKVKISLRRSFGDVEVESESLDELVEKLQELPDWLLVIEKLITGSEAFDSETKGILKDFVEFTENGPILTVGREKIHDKEAIGLILYAGGSKAFTAKEVKKLLALSGRRSIGFGARLSEMRREGLVTKDGSLYKLTYAGRKWAEELMQRLHGVG
ncbi:hypothetical protein KEJ36_01930 [Candidatus Bathyarchaeota archaeon]|nr:hypothetical protein [Candidatus Bathyarchaeota archaeon]MBS7627569.1 hypothetical protein [Candidatus Bathyarchaeota archaeon]